MYKSVNMMAMVFIIALVIQAPTWAQNAVTITKPAPGDVFEPGEKVILKWESLTVFSVNIEISLNNGKSYTLLNTKSIHKDSDQWNNFIWEVPEVESDSCILVISDYGDFSNYGESGNFSIRKKDETPPKKGCGAGAVSALIVPVFFRVHRKVKKSFSKNI